MDNKQFVETPLQSKKEINTMDSQKKKTSQKGEQQQNQKKNLKKEKEKFGHQNRGGANKKTNPKLRRAADH
jgi:hypothetical protein